jgi:hypothetical protein
MATTTKRVSPDTEEVVAPPPEVAYPTGHAGGQAATGMVAAPVETIRPAATHPTRPVGREQGAPAAADEEDFLPI